jgi:ethanolamine utilization protein EutA
MTEPEGEGRIFFSNAGRTLALEDELLLTSVGVDIGSSTSHLVFSRILLERLDSRYIVTERETVYRSDILLTPYTDAEAINAAALGAFIEQQYKAADISPDAIDSGALILTGVAVQRKNARAIGELFARQAGKLVAVSAGDGLETTMAAYGSGAVARSIRDGTRVLNVDLGGGTAKLALCAGGRVASITALDVGARLVALDDRSCIVRVEDAGRRFANDLGIELTIGKPLAGEAAAALAEQMADAVFLAIEGKSPVAGGTSLLRLDPLDIAGGFGTISFSGGVAEYIYGASLKAHGDLGPLLAAAVRARITARGLSLAAPAERIRATVIGAAQYTVQVSGSTIYVSPLEALPLRNLPVATPDWPLDRDELDVTQITAAIHTALRRLDLASGDAPLALFVPWRGTASFDRLDAFCRGVAEALAPALLNGHPLVLVGDGDVGGLIGIHCREELGLASPIVSIDGLDLKEFDYIDIGAMLDTSGAVPVVIKSLVFPANTRR